MKICLNFRIAGSHHPSLYRGHSKATTNLEVFVEFFRCNPISWSIPSNSLSAFSDALRRLSSSCLYSDRPACIRCHVHQGSQGSDVQRKTGMPEPRSRKMLSRTLLTPARVYRSQLCKPHLRVLYPALAAARPRSESRSQQYSWNEDRVMDSRPVPDRDCRTLAEAAPVAMHCLTSPPLSP